MKSCVILVGHGGVPTDCPPELVAEFKRQEAAAKGKPTPALAAADKKVRDWPRTPATDPYKTGLESVASALRQALPGRRVLEAYNEFCGPSLEQALEAAVAGDAASITVISTMFTRGGIHSETEIPQILAAFRRAHPGVEVRYCWPFDLSAIGAFLAAEVVRAESGVGAR